MGLFDWITQIDYLGWSIIGILLAIAELFVPGSYLVCISLSSFTMGVLVNFIEFTTTKSIVITFFALSTVYTALGWWFYNKVLDKIFKKAKKVNNTESFYIGKTCQLTKDVVGGRAQAKVGDGFWIVETEDEDLKQGDKVKIIGVQDGVILKVERYEKN